MSAPVPLCRDAIAPLLLAAPASAHPGLLLARGLTRWSKDDPEGRKTHLDKLCKLRPSPLYVAALERWRQKTGDPARFASLELALEQRLYIGVTRDNALETGVTTSHAYGMPLIPGSAVKGLARAVATRHEFAQGALKWLFGDQAESGGLIFHDAWWVGKAEDSPFVREVVTPHHPDYYGSHGATPASDFDAPVPAAQIAVRGAFYFVVEGHRDWVNAGVALVKRGLAEQGIGGKRSSGYGYFVQPSC